MATPTREAIVLVTTNGSPLTPHVEIDPIILPLDSAGIADVFHPGLIGLMDAMTEWEATTGGMETGFQLVWSDTQLPVTGTCPVCDDFFIVSEGFSGDELNEGYEAVCCGCDPRDQG
jgi:hypothetical protein